MLEIQKKPNNKLMKIRRLELIIGNLCYIVYVQIMKLYWLAFIQPNIYNTHDVLATPGNIGLLFLDSCRTIGGKFKRTDNLRISGNFERSFQYCLPLVCTAAPVLTKFGIPY